MGIQDFQLHEHKERHKGFDNCTMQLIYALLFPFDCLPFELEAFIINIF